MDRDRLLEEMLSATTPNETSTAMYEARGYLAEHPDDAGVLSAMEALIEVEREVLVL